MKPIQILGIVAIVAAGAYFLSARRNPLPAGTATQGPDGRGFGAGQGSSLPAGKATAATKAGRGLSVLGAAFAGAGSALGQG